MPHTSTHASFLARGLLALLVAFAALGSACDTEPLVRVQPRPTPGANAPEPFERGPDGEPAPDPDVQPEPDGCGDIVIEGVGFIIDFTVHDDKLVVAAEAGLFIEDETQPTGFRQLDTSTTWRVRSVSATSLVASTSTGYTWDSFTIVRYDGDALVRTELLTPADLAALAAAHQPPANDGSVPHTVVADYVVVNDELVFTANDVLLVDHLGVGAPAAPYSHVFAMPLSGLADGALPTLRVDAQNAGAMAARGADVFFTDGSSIARLVNEDAQTLFSSVTISPQRIEETADALYFTSGLDGAVARVTKATGDVVIYDSSPSHWDADVAVSAAHVYWSQVSFTGGEGPSIRRAAVNDPGAVELVNDCIAQPDKLLVHAGSLVVASADLTRPALVKIALPD